MNIIQKWWQKFLGIFKKKVDDVVNPNPEPDPSTDPFAVEKAEEKKYAFTHSATITNRHKLISINASYIDVEDEIENWPENDGCNAEAHAYVLRNGAWVGGKYDHARPKQQRRVFSNIYNGYGKWKDIGKPIRGENVAFLYVSYDGKNRTNAVFAEWQGD